MACSKLAGALLIAMFALLPRADAYGMQWEAQQSYNRALRHRGVKEYDKAIDELKHVTIKYPSFYRAYISLHLLYEQLKQSETARRYFQARLSEDRNNPYVNYVLGLMSKQDGDLGQARLLIERCVELAPDFITAYNKLVEIAAERGELEELRRKSTDAISEGLSAGAHFTMGRIYQLQRDWEKAEAHFKTAMQMTSPSWELQYSIFRVYFNSNRLNEALTVAQEIHLRLRESDDLEVVEIISAYIGLIYRRLDYYTQAANFLDQSIRISREIGSGHLQLQSHLANRGAVYRYQGKYKQALEMYEQALRMAREGNDKLNEGRNIGLVGEIYTLMGDYSQALAAYTQALRVARGVPDLPGECGHLLNLGLIYLELGDDPRAMETASAAIKIARQVKLPWQEAGALELLGQVYEKSGRKKEAIDTYMRNLSVARQIQARHAEATSNAHIGGVYVSMRDYSKALSSYERALSIANEIGAVDIEAGIHNKLGGLRLRLGQYAQAAADHERALELGNRIRSPEIIWRAQAGLARAMEKQRKFDVALSYYRRAIETIETIRGKLGIAEDKAGYLADKIDTYHQLVRLLIESGKEKDRIEAFHYVERARARSLIDLLTEARVEADGQPDIDDDLRRRLTEIGAHISEIQSRLSALHSEKAPNMEPIKRLEADLDKAEGDHRMLQREIRRRHPRYAELHYPEPINLDQAQDRLNDQTLLLEYVVGQEGSYLFAVSKKEYQVVRLPEAQSIDGRVRKLRDAVARPYRRTVSTYITQARLLYQDLIRPIESMLPGKKELIIIPDGILHYLPFELLIPSNSPISAHANLRLLPYLISDYGISYVSSASVLASLDDRYQEPQKPQRLLLAYADPAYPVKPGDTGAEPGATAPDAVPPRVTMAPGSISNDKKKQTSPITSSVRTYSSSRWNLTRLAHSREEAEGIEKLYPPESADIFLGETANEKNVKAEGKLSQYRVIHFAVHGLLDESRPQLSGLALSPQDSDREDGLLQVYEIFKLRLRADLVILSACKTGLGKEVKGEGLIGLTRAFMYAGAPSVVVSLWEVLDLSTAELMIEFHRRLRDQPVSKAEALRQSRLQLIRNGKFAHPYYWAPFVLVGKS